MQAGEPHQTPGKAFLMLSTVIYLGGLKRSKYILGLATNTCSQSQVDRLKPALRMDFGTYICTYHIYIYICICSPPPHPHDPPSFCFEASVAKLPRNFDISSPWKIGTLDICKFGNLGIWKFRNLENLEPWG